MSSKPSPYEVVAQSIITALESGEIPPWRKEWVASGVVPTSLSTGKPYKGTNRFLLTFAGSMYASPLWGTYKQIESQGGQVRKGERSTPVVLWKPVERENSDGEKKKGMILRHFNVFNADQADWADGAPTYEKPEPRTDVEISESAQRIIDTYLTEEGLTMKHGGDRAFYSITSDYVQVPEIGYFTSNEAYYSTVFHELGHSTGHKTRLAREGVTEGHVFGDEIYSEEELVAEFTATFLCSETGILPSVVTNSTAYIKGWLKALKDDPKILVRASSRAQKAAEYIINGKQEETTEGEGE